ncbi:MAG: aminopeptidase N, partial [Planctomycetota bacterium]|nr:aminopeptidase N [Planctomycetota bacterium]
MKTIDLRFELDPEATLVTAEMAIERVEDADAPLELDGEALELITIEVDGAPLDPASYTLADEKLTITGLPSRCRLRTQVRVAPERNTALSGLYRSSGNYCTQCEAQGFRRITFFPDRPDVMARYTTEIIASKDDCPVMLSNGNRIEQEDLGDGRHRVRWEDPHVKPSYLFALVAGNLVCERGSFTTMSGREVALEIWVESQDANKCEHALRSLQRSMKWDEEVFGLEYDLDLYMIVAVGDFNMGAMENKGLNIFNSKFVLARPDTATDADYEHIEGVIGHEYFHNWTGNRVTCRDWFQLTLKEGLTVYRDQRFTADMTSAPVKRIDDVMGLRRAQLPEDAGPMAHPIRPESYVAMDNFYTATVYEKGAQVIRMYETLLGREGFRKGMDLYFERHDGAAVTCDDFRAAMADANGADLEQFERWYRQAGTPKVTVATAWDAGTFTLTLTQSCPSGQDADAYQPLQIPVRTGLVGADGSDQPLRIAGERDAPTERVLLLTAMQQTWAFEGLDAEPVPSLLRDYSAPVIVENPRSLETLAFLLASDSDAFQRWDAGQEMFAKVIFDGCAALAGGGEPELPQVVVDAFRSVLLDPDIDGSIRALTLSLPDENELANRMEVVQPEALHDSREALARGLALALHKELGEVYRACEPGGPYQAAKADIDRRRTRAMTLGYLSRLGSPEVIARASRQFADADNMTDAEAALACLCHIDDEARDEALARFYDQWKGEPLVLDKWFTIQAASTLHGAAQRVRKLMQHPDFTLENPNRARSLVGIFAMRNHSGFHATGGEGYRILA